MMNMTMNLKMSLTVRPREICKGPKLSLAGRMYAILEKLRTTAMEYRPSEMSWGSEGSHRFRAVRHEVTIIDARGHS